MHGAAVDMIGQQRATRATLLPFRTEHEVVHDQLASTAKEVGQGFLSARGVEDVLLVYSLPWQFAALSTQFVAQSRELLLLAQQLLSRGKPLRLRRDFRTFSLARRRSHDHFSLPLSFGGESLPRYFSNK